MEQDRLWESVLGQREPLLAWIRARLGPVARRRFDADSVFDSMVKSVCRISHVPEGEKELVSLLWIMTRYKLAKRLRREFAQRRDARLDAPLDSAADHVLPGWTPEEEVVWKELEGQYDEWKRLLPERLCKVVELTEQETSQQDIALEIGISDRQVRRYLSQAENNLREFLGLEPQPSQRERHDHE